MTSGVPGVFLSHSTHHLEASEGALGISDEGVRPIETVQKSFIFKSVLISDSSIMEDVWTEPLTCSWKWISEGTDL